MSPMSRSPSTSDTDIDAATPMLRRYSMWIGETLRSTEKLRSSGPPVSGLPAGVSTAGRASTSRMKRSQLRTYRARAWAGMSVAGKWWPRSGSIVSMAASATISPCQSRSKR